MSDDPNLPQTSPSATAEASVSDAPAATTTEPAKPRTPIKIGSQRQSSGVFRAKPQPLVKPIRPVETPDPNAEPAPTAAPVAAITADAPSPETASPDTASSSPAATLPPAAESQPAGVAPYVPPRKAEKIEPPRTRDPLSDDMEQEFAAMMGGLSMDDMLANAAPPPAADLVPDSVHRGRVMSVRGKDVFIELPGRAQGLLPVSQFEEPPAAGAFLQVKVQRHDPAEGLYVLSLPESAVSVAGWDQLSEGMIVDAAVTGHNAGGLEVEVNKLRGFIPISQVSLYRIENLAEFVGQRLTCVVVEVRAESRKLVLSRRAMLERERAESKTKLLAELEVGQTREGVVTRIQPFGAFVDLGGVDGLIHVSQMSWDRVAHPSEVLEVGKRIKVQIAKLDPQTGKIGLTYRESWENPWETAERRYVPKSTVPGVVTKLMDFGAFVRLEAGIEGLIHI
ncbi:MAG: S1 RNA-binding domain-containing protein, partial [Planctomycetia bacterium]|nr:S1 RNA-binding domain-containing protein [Planctomycetia bacterium]